MSLVRKNHFALTKPQYEHGLLAAQYNSTWPQNLSVQKIDSTYENLHPLMARLSQKWFWQDQPRYNEEALRQKLAQEETSLFLLKDGVKPVGYALASMPPPSIKQRFWGAANDTRVMEIDNLGLFPNQEGGGRGKAYFEMLFKKYFPDFDAVYWAQHETHSPTLRQFYERKMGMTLLDHDFVPDFRQRHREFA